MESNDNMLYRLEALESAYSDKGLFDDAEGVDTHGEKWSHKWAGRIMGDYVNWVNESPALGGQDYFEFRRLRLSVSGKGYGVYDYKFQVEFEPENTITDSDGDLVANADAVGIRDMYVGISRYSFSRLRSLRPLQGPIQSGRTHRQQIHHVPGALAAQYFRTDA